MLLERESASGAATGYQPPLGGPAWLGLVQAWLGSACLGAARLGPARPGSAWLGSARLGLGLGSAQLGHRSVPGGLDFFKKYGKKHLMAHGHIYICINMHVYMGGVDHGIRVVTTETA